METLWLIVTLLIMLVGLVGAVLPVLPSIPIIYAGFFVYGLATGWSEYGLWTMVFFGLFTLFVMAVDYAAGALGARKFGGSREGAICSIIGGVVGVIFFNVIGLIVGVFAGAVLGELMNRRPMDEALRAGWGAFLGFVAGGVFKFISALIMIGTFTILIL